MRALFHRLRRDRRGAGAIEFALLAPVMIMAVIGTAQLGILFFADAGLRSAMAEGARYATIFPRPTDTEIRAKIASGRFGLKQQYLATPTIVPGTANGANYLDITMRYTVHLNFIFFEVPPVTLVEQRRVFVHAPA